MKSQISGAPLFGKMVAAPPSVYEYAIVEELGFVRREAQLEANEAYADWVARESAEAFFVYRAAQDRADAAQDDLATAVRWLTP